VWGVRQNLNLRHSVRQLAKDKFDGDPRSLDHGLAEHDFGVNGNAFVDRQTAFQA
jgi:hypothetical protein